MRTLQFWAFLFAAWTSMAVGLEVERLHMAGTEPGSPVSAPAAVGAGAGSGVGSGVDEASNVDWGAWVRMLPVPIPADWQPLSTRELWRRTLPDSQAWLESLGEQQVHESVWRSAVLPVLAAPPAIWLGALALLTYLLARLRLGQAVPVPGGLRSVLCWAGLALTAVGFGALGADLFRSGDGEWQTRTLGQLWELVHPESLAVWADPSALAGVLEWPAWLVLTLAGGVVAYLSRPRIDTMMYAAQPAAAPPRFIDVSRTLAYLDSMRSGPPRSRRRGRMASEQDVIDPRRLDLD